MKEAIIEVVSLREATIKAHFEGDCLVLELPADANPVISPDGSWSFWLPAEAVEVIRDLSETDDEPASIRVLLADRPPQMVSGYITHAGGDCQVFIDGALH